METSNRYLRMESFKPNCQFHIFQLAGNSYLFPVPAFLFAVLVLFFSSSFSQPYPTTWDSRGPGGGGAIYSPAISPFNQGEIFLSCDMSPVHHSTDFGQSWSLIHFRDLTGQRNSRVQFTSDPDKLFVLKLTPTSTYIPVKSTDAGTTWTAASNPTVTSAYQLLANPHDTDMVVMNDRNKIYFSNQESNPASFITLINKPGTYGNHLAGAYFSDTSNIYICGHDSLLHSTDGGASWLPAAAGTNGIPSTEHIVSFAGAEQGGAMVFYCVTIQANGPANIARTQPDDIQFYQNVYKLPAGQSQWVPLGPGLPTPAQDKVYWVRLSRNDTSIVYLAGIGRVSGISLGTVFRSADAGASWQNVFLDAAAFSNNDHIRTGWLGKSSNPVYKFRWNGLSEMHDLGVDPLDPLRLICTDGMAAHTSEDSGATWRQAYTDSAFDNPALTLVDETKPFRTSGLETTAAYWLHWIDSNFVIATYNDILMRISTDAGQSWDYNIAGLDSTKINDINMVLWHPGTHTLYAAAGELPGSNGDYTDARAALVPGRISVSSDSGRTWSTLKSFGHAVTSIAWDPLTSNGMYASVSHIKGGNGGIYYCADVVASPFAWTLLSSPSRAEGRASRILTLSNGDLIAVFGPRDTSITSTPSYQYSASSGVFYSNDGGLTWMDSTDVNMMKATTMVVVDLNDSTERTWLAFVDNQGTAQPGVYRTTDAGATWIHVVPQTVASATFHPSKANELYLCTRSNGLLYSTNTNTNSFVLDTIDSWPYRNAERMFFNPYNENEVWVATFGNGFRSGTLPTVVSRQQFSFIQEEGIKVYPIPASGSIFVEIPQRYNEGILYVIDMYGKEIRHFLWNRTNDEDREIQLGAIPAGIYSIIFRSEDWSGNARLLIGR